MMMYIMLLQYSVISVNFHDWTNFVCVNDKHKINVGQPGNPLAAAECGIDGYLYTVEQRLKYLIMNSALYRQLPCLLTYLKIFLDHAWYRGQVNWTSTEDAFEPSSPHNHSAELANFLISHGVGDKPIVCLYSDGGSDHKLTYLSVKAALISLFLFLDLDYLSKNSSTS